MATREELIASAPEYIWADQVMGIWLDRDQPDRRSPLVKYRRADAALPQGEDVGGMLSNLLARSHRDGGHYEAKHGTVKAVADADEIVCRLHAQTEAQAAQIASLSAKVADVERERDEAETERTDMMWQRRRAEETAKAAEGRAPEMQQEVERLQSVILRAADILYHNLGRQDEKVRDVEPLLRAALQQEGK